MVCQVQLFGRRACPGLMLPLDIAFPFQPVYILTVDCQWSAAVQKLSHPFMQGSFACSCNARARERM